jgi:V/A-type H+-transporting ATPase subunit G/H
MGKEEILLKLKEAESQIRALKEAAERDREQALRTARREALELREKMREQAEARYREILKAAESALATERERIVAAGRADAAKIAAMGRTNVDKAVEHVLQKFKGALHV